MPSSTRARRSQRLGALLVALLSVFTLAACSDDGLPEVRVTVGEQSVAVQPTLYCQDGRGLLDQDQSGTNAMQVSPDEQIRVDVPEVVAEKHWTIQIWSVDDSSGSAVPYEQIGNIDAGTATSFDGFTTSDAAPDRYFVIVAIPEDPNCDALASAGIWTVLLSRQG